MIEVRIEQETMRASAARAAFEQMETCVEMYLAHYRQKPYAPESLVKAVERMLYKSIVGDRMYAADRSMLLARTRRAVRDSASSVVKGRPAIPPEVLGVAVHVAQMEREERRLPMTVEGAFKAAARRLRKDFGVIVSPDAIKATHLQHRKQVKAKKS